MGPSVSARHGLFALFHLDIKVITHLVKFQTSNQQHLGMEGVGKRGPNLAKKSHIALIGERGQNGPLMNCFLFLSALRQIRIENSQDIQIPFQVAATKKKITIFDKKQKWLLFSDSEKYIVSH